MTNKRNVSLPEDLCASAEQKYGREFESIESLLEFVLQELLRDDAEKLDEKEKAILEKRLRDLGYM
ncbi:MAG TPA: hypothetical protein VL983_03390 [Terriglobales bacterium]|nr:hypothetical protein [Terriglobales bacterium]